REALLGRRSEGDPVLFKSVGHALFDLAAVRHLLGLD
ncbi:MAG: ornithine cyclodeaminase, partial [Thermus sp.]